MIHPRLLAAAGVLVLVSACSASDPAPSASSGAATDSTASTPTTAEPASPPIDDALAERTVAISDPVRVGVPLRASISPDLAGEIESWGWQRCIWVPSCQTISTVDAASYTPTVDDAWQVLRVVAVARRPDAPPGAVTTVVGPVVNPDPEAFAITRDVDPSDPTGVRTIVAPGEVRITIEAGCPVQVVAGIRTASVERSALSAEHDDESSSDRHRITLDGDGGELTVAAVGDCDRAEIRIEATR